MRASIHLTRQRTSLDGAGGVTVGVGVGGAGRESQKSLYRLSERNKRFSEFTAQTSSFVLTKQTIFYCWRESSEKNLINLY